MQPQAPDQTSLRFRDAFVSAQRVLLTGPMDSDGDSLGSCLALARAIRAISGAVVHVAGTPAFRYQWMPGADQMIRDDQVVGPYDVAVVLDGNRRRLHPVVERAYEAARSHAIIDHHSSTDTAGYELVCLDPTAASTCELVHQLTVSWGVPIDATIAALLYTGVIFDTGGFRHSNTHPSTHRLAASLLETGIDHALIAARVLSERRLSGQRLLGHVLSTARALVDGEVVLGIITRADLAAVGATDADIEGVVDALVFTTGAEIACLIVERPMGRVKLSLRSRRWVDVAALAREIAAGGGGHRRAAGVVMEDTLASAERITVSALTSAMARSGAHAQG